MRKGPRDCTCVFDPLIVLCFDPVGDVGAAMVAMRGSIILVACLIAASVGSSTVSVPTTYSHASLLPVLLVVSAASSVHLVPPVDQQVHVCDCDM